MRMGVDGDKQDFRGQLKKWREIALVYSPKIC